MAGEIFFSKNRKSALKELKGRYPSANKFFIDSSPTKAPKGMSAFYGIADKVDRKTKKLVWHN